MHALIIEDEPTIALLIEDCLRDLGYTSIDFAVTEIEAIASAGARCPDLITSDVRLAQGCGIAAVRAICQDKTIPVIFVTATSDEVLEKMGETVVVTKPFTQADFGQALSTIQLDL